VHIVLIKFLTVAVIVLLAGAVEAVGPGDLRGYTLAPGDRITVTVFGQTDLSGDFLIDGAGEIQLPLLGAVHVGQSTIEECRQRLTERLAAGFIKNPNVSVRVNEFRPIFVLGDVRTPGSYPFRFGLSGMSAIALAGGVGLPDLRPGTALADLAVAEERVKVLVRTQLGLLVRLARVEAERMEKTSFEVPEIADVSDDEIAPVLREEQEQMSIAMRAYEQTIELLNQQRPKVRSEIEITERQIQIETSQLTLIQSKLKDFETLAKQGLGRSITELDLQRQFADREGNISRLKGDLARLDSKLGDLDIRGQEAENARRTRVMGDLRDIKVKLREIETQLPSAREVLELRQLQAGAAGDGEDLQRSYRILLTRGAGRQQVPLSMHEDVALEPGDMLEVRRLKTDARQTAAPLATAACDPSYPPCAEKRAAALGGKANAQKTSK
jgi:polysaccharide export outer membrane protein